MAVTQVGSSWTVSWLGDHVLVDSQSDANTIDAALTAVAGTDAYPSVLASYMALSTGGNWGHIKTLAAPPVVASVIPEIDGGAAT